MCFNKHPWSSFASVALDIGLGTSSKPSAALPCIYVLLKGVIGLPSRQINYNESSANLYWLTSVAGELDSVGSVSATACHIGGKITY